MVTDRLRLVPIGVDDAPHVAALHADPLVTRWYGAWDETMAERFAQSMRRSWRTRRIGAWLAHDLVTDTVVGLGGPLWTRLRGRQNVELIFAMAGTWAGRGLATELGHAALDFAFRTVATDRVLARAATNNAACRNLLHRLGMTEVDEVLSTAPATAEPGARQRTLYVVAEVTRREWRESRAA